MSDLIDLLKKQAKEIATEGHSGWGNTMLAAADELTQYREMFEGLRVEEECSNDNEDINELINRCPIEGNIGCEMKQGKVMKQCSGKLHRPLTMDERKEWFIFAEGYSLLQDIILPSGVKVVRVK